MKKLRYKHGVARSQEQPRPLETSIFAEQQQLAKSGQITSPSGADPVIRALGDASPVTNTLAGIVRDAFGATPILKKAIVNFAARKVTIVPEAANLGALTGHADTDGLSAVVSQDDPTKASSPVTLTEVGLNGDEFSTELETPVKPSMSIESMLNRVEDILNDPTSAHAIAGKSVIAIVDQEEQTVSFYQFDTDDAAAIDCAALFAEDAEFVQTLVSSTGRQFGE